MNERTQESIDRVKKNIETIEDEEATISERAVAFEQLRFHAKLAADLFEENY